MKYLEQYIEEKLKIKVLGKLATRESNSGEEVGVSLVIDGYEPGIEVWYADYCSWLEEKIEYGEISIRENNDNGTSEKMVPVEKVKEWFDKEFYITDQLMDDFGEFPDVVVSYFQSKEGMFKNFMIAMEE